MIETSLQGRGRWPVLTAACLTIILGCLAAGCGSVQAPTRDEVFRPLRIEATAPPAVARTAPLTLAEAIALAGEHSPAVITARLQADAALAAARAAGDLRDPELRVGFGRTDVDASEASSGSGVERLILPRDYYETLYPYEPPKDEDNDGVFETPGGRHYEKEGPTYSTNRASRSQSQEERFNSLALRIFPPNPWAMAAAISGARAALHAAEARYFEERRLVEIEVRRLFAEGAYAEREAAALDRLAESRKRLLDAAKQAMLSGRYTQADMLQFHRQYLDTIADRDKARRNRERVRHQLAVLVRLPASSLTVAFGSAVPPDAVPDGWTPDQLWELALEHRGDLAALYWDAMILRSEWREAEAARIPWFAHIQGGYSWSDEDASESSSGTDESRTRHSVEDPDIIGGRYAYTERRLGEDFGWASGSQDTEEWSISAAITLPVFSWFDGKVKASRAEYRLAERSAHFARIRVRDDVAAALEQVRSLARIRAEYAAASQSVLKEMRASMDEIRSNQAMPEDEFLKTEVQILDAERLVALYEYEYSAALIDLREKAGALPDDRPAAPQDAAPALRQ